MKSNKEQGVTLIALVVTLVILLILAAVSIYMLLGDNGLITKAQQAAEQMQIASGKEEIDLQVLDLVTGKIQKGESCTLEYIKEELPKRLDLSVTGEKGDPLQAIYVDYKNYEYEIDDSFIVKYAGEGSYTERPTLTLSLDQTQTGVEKVVITAEAEIIDGTIEEIEKPNGEKQQGNSTTYEVTENGDYTFVATSDRGRITSKTINITNIKEDGIDLTGLVTGEDPGHEHVYINSFDDTSHYEECMICGLKQNVVAHTITRKMAIENTAVCAPINYYIDSCSCGYYKEGHIPHTTDNQWHTTSSSMSHYTLCSVCQNWPQSARCITADGKQIDCNNIGTCSICGYAYTEKTHHNITDNGICGTCGEQVLDVLEFNYEYDAQNNLYTFIYRFKILDNNIHIIDNSGWIWRDGTSEIGLKSTSISNSRENGVETVKFIVKPTERYQSRYNFGGRIKFTYGSSTQEYNIVFGKNIVPATAQSSIDEVTVTNIGEVDGWAKQKQITVKGSDNWSNQVKLSMQDEEGNVVYQEVVVPVQNNTYTYTFIPEIEADSQGKTYKVVVKDVFDQSKTKDITVYNIDFKEPELVSQTEYTEDWSRTKNITVEATDEGSGNVQIAFNNEADYQVGEQKDGKYIRNYIFTGEVYTPVQGAIYLKDALGNYQMTTIKIGKMDNTSPTITNVQTEKTDTGTKVTIEANDINEKLGEEGSGIAGYAITTSKELPTERSYGTSKEIEVEKAGTYYIYVKDNTGNVSARYTVEIAE